MALLMALGVRPRRPCLSAVLQGTLGRRFCLRPTFRLRQQVLDRSFRFMRGARPAAILGCNLPAYRSAINRPTVFRTAIAVFIFTRSSEQRGGVYNQRRF